MIARSKVFETFFDRARVKGAMSAAARRNLSKAGAFVRTSARSSIRKRKRVASPGNPPSSHQGDLKRNIFFGYDVSRETVIVGPALLDGRRDRVPELTEFGGTITGRDRRTKKRRAMRYAPHPFMGPALNREAPKFPGLWADTLR